MRLLLRELGRLRLRDAGRQPALRRQRQHPHLPWRAGRLRGRATPIVEVKNLNSFRAVERAIRYEAERQYEQFQAGRQEARRPRCQQGDGRLGRRPRPDRRAAPQGGGRRLPLLPRAGPGAGRGRATPCWRRPAPAWANCRRPVRAPAAAVRPVGVRRRRADPRGAGLRRLLRGGGPDRRRRQGRQQLGHQRGAARRSTSARRPSPTSPSRPRPWAS